MNWTKTKPTKPGHYWTSYKTDDVADKRSINETAHVVELYEYDGHLQVSEEGTEDFGVNDRVWWAGPIELPDPPGYQPSGWPAFK